MLKMVNSGPVSFHVNKENLATYALEAVIRRVEDLVLLAKARGEGDLDPSHALRELQAGLSLAAKLARELSPRNFVPEEIEALRQT
jgi:hypothetical protein